MRKIFQSLIAGFIIGVLAVGIQPIYAAQGDILTYTGSGSLNSTEVFRVDSVGGVRTASNIVQTTTGGTTTYSALGGVTSQTGNATIASPSDMYFGLASVAQSSTVAAGLSQGTLFTAILAGGVPAIEGSVLVAVSSGAIGGTSLTVAVAPGTSLVTSVVGIAATAASTGSVVNVYDTGWVNVQTVGAVVAGDQVYTSTVPGFATNLAFSTGPVIGIALQAASNVFGGFTRIKLR